ncbi:unnamed protein product [Cuscuta epithymum]|uniref:Reverse transcriptase Ty1/copia-type domain-containing protein n=1 Tax=Cuscuta epithymum TaxID=186058 RepID=A0AAV0D1C4_9ASTE|nr:unnamed protein product [Cuscuta epithymum]
MDVITAFVRGYLDKKNCKAQLEGFVELNKSDYVCLLQKSLYGLKQSPGQWNIKFVRCMKSMKFVKSSCDHCLYYKDPSFVRFSFIANFPSSFAKTKCFMIGQNTLM